MSELTFEEPLRLVLLIAVAAIVIVYLVVQRRRAAYAVRFADVDLLASVAPRRPGWRRHLTAGLLVAALALMTAAFAKPAAAVEVPQQRATIMVALDVSLSMQATDVDPTRFEAAQQAAVEFVDGLPDTFEVGLVAFDGTASLVVEPTDDRTRVVQAIGDLGLGEGTAIGDAVATSVQAATAASDAEDSAPARVVLLSDGTNTQGRSLDEAARLARAAAIPVATIAYGTTDGSVTVQGQQIPVPTDPAALEKLAADTGGQSYTAATGAQLQDVYDDIGEQVASKTEHQEISAGVAGLALLAGLGAAAMSLAWSPRLP